MTLEGYIDQVRYYNEENGYTVLDLVTDEETLTCCGYFPDFREGESIQVEGENSFHPTYGPQFKVSSFKLIGMKDAFAVERYLASGAIKGIGPATASKIVRKFGEDSYRILEEEPERLAEIKGISESKAREIASQLVEQTSLRQAMFFLQQYGISVKLCTKIYQFYKDDIYQVVKSNPYQLASDVEGIGFLTADEIAQKSGIEADFPYRIKSGMLFVLKQAQSDGHTYLPYELFMNRSASLLGLLTDELNNAFGELMFSGEIVTKKTVDTVRVYLKSVFQTEKSVTRKLISLSETVSFDEEETKAIIEEVISQEKLVLEEAQEKAVLQSVGENVSVITGGPGTGKTTIINILIRCFNRQGMDVLLAAPTGRAAKRMTEATGYEAKTIHRMLEVNATTDDEGGGYFGRNEEYPLEADVVIIDEMSMVDIYLMDNLLKALTIGMKLVLVGDMNQLPSVGPGTVLKDIVLSHAFAVMELKQIFRQAAESDIVTNAHKIQEGKHILLDNKSKDFFFLQRTDTDVVLQSIRYLVTKKLPPYVKTTPAEIQVVTPTRKGRLGVEELNKMLQEALNPADRTKREKSFGSVIFREGDKVMQTKNNYQLEWEVFNSLRVRTDHGNGVFNGDIGVIRSIDPFMEKITVIFDDIRSVIYEFSQLEELELAYAITVHKSQGSEYPAVVMPVLGAPKVLMTRNLLYTAVTRAKKSVVIVGSMDVLYGMIDNPTEFKRYSGLIDCIKEAESLGERK